MRAIILAAGKGERIKEVTKSIPKPMILYKGKPVLQYNIELCKKYGVTDIYINIHHFAEQIQDYFGDGNKFGVNIKYSFEEELLGTSGAVRRIAEKYWGLIPSPDLSLSKSPSPKEIPFFIIYGDQFSSFNLDLLLRKYDENECTGVIAFHHREDVSHSGVAEFDGDQKVIRFVEKPLQGETESHWVNAGIYLLHPEILGLIPQAFSDFGREIFPSALGKGVYFYGVCEEKSVMVFDTPEMYNKNING
ncbi:MAG: nucleotidyltransferase family protein [Bacteroidetes bacterium]|nr:nucleotidyltransferase family protein [Bacteroidota bacterium]